MTAPVQQHNGAKNRGSFQVDVIYALAERQVVVQVQSDGSLSIRQLALQAGMTTWFADIDVSGLALGVFGEQVADDYIVQAGDRIEIYRELDIDPKEARRQRAAEKKAGRKKNT